MGAEFITDEGEGLRRRLDPGETLLTGSDVTLGVSDDPEEAPPPVEFEFLGAGLFTLCLEMMRVGLLLRWPRPLVGEVERA